MSSLFSPQAQGIWHQKSCLEGKRLDHNIFHTSCCFGILTVELLNLNWPFSTVKVLYSFVGWRLQTNLKVQASFNLFRVYRKTNGPLLPINISRRLSSSSVNCKKIVVTRQQRDKSLKQKLNIHMCCTIIMDLGSEVYWVFFTSSSSSSPPSSHGLSVALKQASWHGYYTARQVSAITKILFTAAASIALFFSFAIACDDLTRKKM